jgi:hypothetical protein
LQRLSSHHGARAGNDFIDDLLNPIVGGSSNDNDMTE